MVACGPQDGRGHLGRALSIADALVGLGQHPELDLIRGDLGPIEAKRAASIGLPMVASTTPGERDVVVLDVPDVRAEASRFDAERLVVIDDRDALASPAAIVIQPSLPAWGGGGPAGQVLAGYRFAPVGLAYRRLRAARAFAAEPTPAGRAPVHVLVCFGGSDPANVSGRLAGVLADGDGWDAEVVLGLDSRAEPRDWTVAVSRDPDDLPARIAAADMVLIGAGTMKFEVACVGVPAILLAVADDQRAVGPPFAATGAARYLGDGREIELESVRAAIGSLAADAPSRARMAATASATVDGDGAIRIAWAVAALLATAG